MKKNMYSVLLFLLAGFPAISYGTRPSADTTFTYRNKTISLNDSVGQIKVHVYDASNPTNKSEYKQVFEGIYSDEKSYESWTVSEEIGFQIPFLRKKIHRHQRMIPHWSGLGLGFVNVTDQSLGLKNIGELDIKPINNFNLKAERSHEFIFNFSESILPIFRNNLGITTGMGFDFRNYHFEDNVYLIETNGITGMQDAPPGIYYTYSRLRTVYLTVPLLLEWQPTLGGNHCTYISAGIVAGVKTFSSSKVKYENTHGHTERVVMDRGLNVRPLTLDYMVQAGYKNCRIYAKYAPFGIFQANKGPKVHSVSLGFILGN